MARVFRFSFVLLLCVLCLTPCNNNYLLFSGSPLAVEASLIGIDLGSEFIKVAGPKGTASIEILLNEQARRKTVHFVGFRGTDRFFGDDAKNLAPRFPRNMFGFLNRIAGLAYDSKDRKWLEDSCKLNFKLEENKKRGSINVLCGENPQCNYTAEELLGMLFAYIKDFSEKDMTKNVSITDAVVTIPAFFDLRQRQAIVDAATLAGLRVVALMHSTTAAALQYGVQKRGYGNETVNVVIFDMGSTSTQIGVYSYAPTPPPADGKKLKLADSLGTITTLHIQTDSELGGRSFDHCMAKMIEKEYMKKTKQPAVFVESSDPTKKYNNVAQKAAFSLMRAANGAKERLSANTQTPVTVEGIAPDRDFHTSVSREAFEKECAPLFARAVQLAKDALQGAGLNKDDITNFEFMGGGSRVPKLFTDLSEMLGRPVDRTMNTDEAAALGATFYGAKLSGYFRVRSFAIKEKLEEDITMRLSPKTDLDLGKKEDIEGGEKQQQQQIQAQAPVTRPLFTDSLFGSRKSMVASRLDEFNITLFENAAPWAVISTKNLRSVLHSIGYLDPKIPHENNTQKVRLEFKLQESGLVTLEETEVKYNYVANLSRMVKVPLNTTSSETEGEGGKSGEGEDSQQKEKENAEQQPPTTTSTTEEATTEGEEKKKDEEGGEDTNTTAQLNTTSSSLPKKNYTLERVYYLDMRKKTMSVLSYLHFPADIVRRPVPMDTEDMRVSKAILYELDQTDELKRATSFAKNDLETYIQWIKNDGILDNSEIVRLGFMSETDAEQIRKEVSAAQEWLEEGEGSEEDAKLEQFLNKIEELKNGTTGEVAKKYQDHLDVLAEIKRNETIALEKKKKEEMKNKKKKAGRSKTSSKKKKGKKSSAKSEEDTTTEGGEKEEEQESTENQPPKQEEEEGNERDENVAQEEEKESSEQQQQEPSDQEQQAQGGTDEGEKEDEQKPSEEQEL